MKDSSRQIQEFEHQPSATFNPKVKCVLMAAFQHNGKTILQPLVAPQEAEKTSDIFRNKTLEVWLSNGRNDIAEFDISILKYTQALQPLTKCQKLRGTVCLKNHIENIVSCEQCPLSVREGEISDGKS